MNTESPSFSEEGLVFVPRICTLSLEVLGLGYWRRGELKRGVVAQGDGGLKRRRGCATVILGFDEGLISCNED
jgi:hypothetical protein